MTAAPAPSENADAPDDASFTLAGRMTLALGLRDEEDFRLAVIKRVARRIGDDNYPEFLRVLLVVACSHDIRAKRMVAGTLAVALKRTDLPSGRISSWGASQLSPNQPAVSASELTGQFFSGAPQRQLGPIEYLTVWHHQRTQRDTLDEPTYAFALASMIDLINSNDEARERYIQKLKAESERQIEGAYTGASRKALQRIAQQWAKGVTPQAIAQSVIEHDAASSSTLMPSDWVVRPL